VERCTLVNAVNSVCTTAIRRLCKNRLILPFQKTWTNEIPVGATWGRRPTTFWPRGPAMMGHRPHCPHGVGAYATDSLFVPAVTLSIAGRRSFPVTVSLMHVYIERFTFGHYPPHRFC